MVKMVIFMLCVFYHNFKKQKRTNKILPWQSLLTEDSEILQVLGQPKDLPRELRMVFTDQHLQSIR